jgi:hypothetical protein
MYEPKDRTGIPAVDLELRQQYDHFIAEELATNSSSEWWPYFVMRVVPDFLKYSQTAGLVAIGLPGYVDAAGPYRRPNANLNYVSVKAFWGISCRIFVSPELILFQVTEGQAASWYQRSRRRLEVLAVYKLERTDVRDPYYPDPGEIYVTQYLRPIDLVDVGSAVTSPEFLIAEPVPLDRASNNRVAESQVNPSSANGANKDGEVVGRWRDNINPAWDQTITIRREKGAIYLVSEFSDGGTRKVPVTEVEPRTFKDLASRFGEYYRITEDGDLALYDNRGYIRTAKQIRTPSSEPAR